MGGEGPAAGGILFQGLRGDRRPCPSLLPTVRTISTAGGLLFLFVLGYMSVVIWLRFRAALDKVCHHITSRHESCMACVVDVRYNARL